MITTIPSKQSYNGLLVFSITRRILIYLEVGRLLHLIAIIASILAYLTFNKAQEAFYAGSETEFYIYGLFFLHFVSLPFYAQLDARSRFQNYKMICDLFHQYGYRDRFIKNLKHSKCQREAAYFAGKSLGYKHQVKKFYYQCGYRWYHFFPDFVLSRPDYLLSKQFWLTTFFIKTYKSRYHKI